MNRESDEPKRFNLRRQTYSSEPDEGHVVVEQKVLEHLGAAHLDAVKMFTWPQENNPGNI